MVINTQNTCQTDVYIQVILMTSLVWIIKRFMAKIVVHTRFFQDNIVNVKSISIGLRGTVRFDEKTNHHNKLLIIDQLMINR